MSGGSFDYISTRVGWFADELEQRLNAPKVADEYGHIPNDFSAEVMAELRSIERQARRVGALMKEADYLYSGDTGGESFLQGVREIHGMTSVQDGTTTPKPPFVMSKYARREDLLADAAQYYEARSAELEQVARAMRTWIDALPKDIVLPTMPGFDRDWADGVIDNHD